MPKKKASSSGKRSASENPRTDAAKVAGAVQVNEFTMSGALPIFTGRLLISLPDGSGDRSEKLIRQASNACGVKDICRSSDFSDNVNMAEADNAEMLVFDEFGIGILSADDDSRENRRHELMKLGLQVDWERWNYQQNLDADLSLDPGDDSTNPTFGIVGQSGKHPLNYLKGFRDGLSHAIEQFEGLHRTDLERPSFAFASDFADSSIATWGLQATGVLGSIRSGTGVKVAVLDSGFDVTHPDFLDGRVTTASFIPATTTDQYGRTIVLNDRNQDVDISGHGTHCVGTACGPRLPMTGPRYGVAHGSQVFSGKVLSVIPGTRRAGGKDAWILDGIRWALREGCSVISMSLGSKVARGEGFVNAYEDLARSAFQNGVLIIAAAGNDSDRRINLFQPVSSPANCPSIISVAAVTPQVGTTGVHGTAYFSNRHLNDQGGEINFCGPGLGVLSSYPNPRTTRLDGTSQATPHVAGIAALVQEETGKNGRDLYLELRARAKQQGLRVDYGNGLIQA